MTNLLKLQKKTPLFYLLFYLLTAFGNTIYGSQNKKVKEIFFSPILPEIIDFTDLASTGLLPVDLEKGLAIIKEVQFSKKVVLFYGYGDVEYQPGSWAYKQNLLLIAKRNDDIPSAKVKNVAKLDLAPYLPHNISSRQLFIFTSEVRPEAFEKNIKWVSNLGYFGKIATIPFIKSAIKSKTVKAQYDNMPGQEGQITVLSLAYKEAIENNPTDNTRIGKAYFEESQNAYRQHVGWTQMKVAFNSNLSSLQEGVKIYLRFIQEGDPVYLVISITEGDALSEIRQNLAAEKGSNEKVPSILGTTQKVGEISIGIDQLQSKNRSEKQTSLMRVDPLGIFRKGYTITSSVDKVVEHIKKECLRLRLQFSATSQSIATNTPLYKWSVQYTRKQQAAETTNTVEDDQFYDEYKEDIPSDHEGEVAERYSINRNRQQPNALAKLGDPHTSAQNVSNLAFGSIAGAAILAGNLIGYLSAKKTNKSKTKQP